MCFLHAAKMAFAQAPACQRDAACCTFQWLERCNALLQPLCIFPAEQLAPACSGRTGLRGRRCLAAGYACCWHGNVHTTAFSRRLPGTAGSIRRRNAVALCCRALVSPRGTCRSERRRRTLTRTSPDTATSTTSLTSTIFSLTRCAHTTTCCCSCCCFLLCRGGHWQTGRACAWHLHA